MAAAVRVVAAQGLGAPTASIAKKAGVSNGSLFTYYESKAELLNELYTDLKAEMAAAALDGLSEASDNRSQLLHMWRNWLGWAVDCPEKRRALAQLSVSDAITPQSREATSEAMFGVVALIDRSRAKGVLRDAPLGFVSALMSAVADTTTDFMISDPAEAEKHCIAGFESLWRMLA